MDKRIEFEFSLIFADRIKKPEAATRDEKGISNMNIGILIAISIILNNDVILRYVTLTIPPSNRKQGAHTLREIEPPKYLF